VVDGVEEQQVPMWWAAVAIRARGLGDSDSPMMMMVDDDDTWW